MTSISRKLGNWAGSLTYDDLPTDVIDRAKGLTLHGLASSLLGQDMPEVAQARAIMNEEEVSIGGPCTTLVHGDKLSKAGAAFVNSEMMFAGGKWDTFRMLTHPGCAILPTALAAAESESASGKEFLTGIVAAYEVMERMAADFIPTVMSRGFHPGPVFGIFGAAVAAAKISGLDGGQIHDAIAQCVNLASGNVEGVRSGGRSLREGAAVRNALLAVSMARHGTPGGETTLEGEAGFYHSYAGNNLGKLCYSFTDDNQTSLDNITKDLGSSWMILETLYRIYSTSGYNIAHVEVAAALAKEHDIKYEDIDHIEAVVNWLETQYPSPAFPTNGNSYKEPKAGSTHYYTAYGAARRGFPLLKDQPRGIGEEDPAEVLDLLNRVTLIPTHRQTLFGPKITIFLKDGSSVKKKGSGREFIWDFNHEAERLQEIIPGIPIQKKQFQSLIRMCKTLNQRDRADQLIKLTQK